MKTTYFKFLFIEVGYKGGQILGFALFDKIAFIKGEGWELI